MTAHDPKQAIIDYLSQPQGPIIPNPPPPPGVKLEGWQGELRQGGGMGARASTIQFHKERRIPHRELHIVTFEDEDGRHLQFTCYVVQDETGEWHCSGGGGGSGPRNAHVPQREYPWANLSGSWGNHFYAGGYVIDNGLDIARVRLVAKDGQSIEDTVENGLVLFLTDQGVSIPVEVELYDRAGQLVGTHPWPRHLPPSYNTATACNIP